MTSTRTITNLADPSQQPTELFVTDAGLETWLTFQRGVDLPAFAAYPLVATPEGRALLSEYVDHYVDIALAADAGLLLETPTWRANPAWAATLGHDLTRLGELIDASVALVAGARSRWTGTRPVLVSGTIGPRGDGYVIDVLMTADEAQSYHSFQIERMAAAGVDLVTAMTLCYADEAIGVVRAATAAGVPAVISFTVETDGRLPSGVSITDAIRQVDDATSGAALHYMINCAHPTHFAGVLDPSDPATARIGGIRANASTLSHAELDEMTVLDDGDPADLAARYVALRDLLPELRVVGGCCGTDHRHVTAIVDAMRQPTS